MKTKEVGMKWNWRDRCWARWYIFAEKRKEEWKQEKKYHYPNNSWYVKNLEKVSSKNKIKLTWLTVITLTVVRINTSLMIKAREGAIWKHTNVNGDMKNSETVRCGNKMKLTWLLEIMFTHFCANFKWKMKRGKGAPSNISKCLW